MSKAEKDFDFSRRAEKYDEGFEGRLSQKFYHALLSQVTLEPMNKVLDVGCGTGYLLKKLAESCEIKGYGIDVESNMIQVAQRQCPDMQIQLSACEKTPFDNDTFDLITACMAYHHFSDKQGFASEAARILKTGGYLYIADPYFPFLIRKGINGLLGLSKVTGEFFTPQEIAGQFCKYGFEVSSLYNKGYVQVVKLKKI